MRGIGKFTAGVVCGCALASGVAEARSGHRAEVNFPGVGVSCNSSSKQLSCFELKPNGDLRPLLHSVGMTMTRTDVIVFKNNKLLFSVHRTGH